MNSTSNRKINPILFLHWGPGGNVEIEKLWFERQSFPPYLQGNVHFWQQQFDGGEVHFEGLLRETEKQIQMELEQGPLEICAHSFGAQVLCRVNPKLLEKLERITLIGAAPNLKKGFSRLAEKLAAQKNDPLLKNLAQEFLNTPEPKNLFPKLVGAVAQYPDFMSLYWGSQSQSAFHRYLELVATREPFNLEIFMKVMTDFFTTQDMTLRPVTLTSVKTEIVLGTDDPFLLLPEDAQSWKSVFPSSVVTQLPVGHFPHFEM